MDKFIETFPEQLIRANTICKTIDDIHFEHDIKNIIISGMGGSGIAGDFMYALYQNELIIPLSINKSYTLPKYANEHTCAIFSSYSGNTEETITALKQAIEKKCNCICITSGGEMEQIALEHNMPLIKIPGGMPPRTCLGYSLVAQMYILKAAQFIHDELENAILMCAKFLKSQQIIIKNKAQVVALNIASYTPVIYSSDKFYPVGLRWKQQLNENAKTQCLINVLPEMNHNELVTYTDVNEKFAVVVLRNDTDAQQLHKRFDLSKTAIKEKTGYFAEIYSSGNTILERMMYLVHFGDWVSNEIALIKNTDAINIDVLDWLKSELNK